MKVTAVIVDRANYGRMKPLLVELQNEDNIQLQVICCGSTLLRRFHHPVTEIYKKFSVSHRIYHEVEGSTDATVVHSMALLMPQLVMAFQQNNPDFVLIIGDRFETLAVATVAAMMKLCVIHVQGGEHSGNIDNSIRHAITKLSHYHLPATRDAYNTLIRLGERKESILECGCPTADCVKDIKPYDNISDHILCIYHPEDCVNNSGIVLYLLNTLMDFKKPVLMYWPNIDSDSEEVVRTIRRFIDINNPTWLTMLVNDPPKKFLETLASVRGCVGNSSSFVRDASFFGTPCIVIGDRQIGRIKTENVLWLRLEILDELYNKMLIHFAKRFKPSDYYGTEGVSKRFVEQLMKTNIHRLKVDIDV